MATTPRYSKPNHYDEAPLEPQEIRNLIVNYLPPSMTTGQLKRIFALYGPIESAKIVQAASSASSGKGRKGGATTSTPRGGSPCNFGFVLYQFSVSAERAVKYLNGYPVEDKTLKVSLAHHNASDEHKINKKLSQEQRYELPIDGESSTAGIGVEGEDLASSTKEEESLRREDSSPCSMVPAASLDATDVNADDADEKEGQSQQKKEQEEQQQLQEETTILQQEEARRRSAEEDASLLEAANNERLHGRFFDRWIAWLNRRQLVAARDGALNAISSQLDQRYVEHFWATLLDMVQEEEDFMAAVDEVIGLSHQRKKDLQVRYFKSWCLYRKENKQRRSLAVISEKFEARSAASTWERLLNYVRATYVHADLAKGEEKRQTTDRREAPIPNRVAAPREKVTREETLVKGRQRNAAIRARRQELEGNRRDALQLVSHLKLVGQAGRTYSPSRRLVDTELLLMNGSIHSASGIGDPASAAVAAASAPSSFRSPSPSNRMKHRRQTNCEFDEGLRRLRKSEEGILSAALGNGKRPDQKIREKQQALTRAQEIAAERAENERIRKQERCCREWLINGEILPERSSPSPRRGLDGPKTGEEQQQTPQRQQLFYKGASPPSSLAMDPIATFLQEKHEQEEEGAEGRQKGTVNSSSAVNDSCNGTKPPFLDNAFAKSPEGERHRRIARAQGWSSAQSRYLDPTRKQQDEWAHRTPSRREVIDQRSREQDEKSLDRGHFQQNEWTYRPKPVKKRKPSEPPYVPASKFSRLMDFLREKEKLQDREHERRVKFSEHEAHQRQKLLTWSGEVTISLQARWREKEEEIIMSMQYETSGRCGGYDVLNPVHEQHAAQRRLQFRNVWRRTAEIQLQRTEAVSSALSGTHYLDSEKMHGDRQQLSIKSEEQQYQQQELCDDEETVRGLLLGEQSSTFSLLESQLKLEVKYLLRKSGGEI